MMKNREEIIFVEVNNVEGYCTDDVIVLKYFLCNDI